MRRNRVSDRLAHRRATSGVLGLSALALVSACGGGGGGDGGGDPTPPPPRESDTAMIVTSDFQSGAYSTIPLDAPTAISRNVGSAHADAVGRNVGGSFYVINRLGGDNVQALDANFGTVWQCSLGNGANPHDIVIVAADKGYVSLYDGGIAVIDPSTGADCDGFVRSTIDLSSFADADGLAETDQMAVVGERLYVTLQRLDRDQFFAPTEASFLAVIDTETDEFVDVNPATPAIDAITLTGTNPFSETKGLTVRSGKIVIAEIGSFGVLDGGIETIDVATNTPEGFFVTEEELGGDITDFVIVSDTRGYAIVADASFNNSLIRFDPSRGDVLAVLTTTSSFLPDIEYDAERGRLLLATRDFLAPGIRIFSSNDEEITTEPIDTGLPPVNIVLP